MKKVVFFYCLCWFETAFSAELFSYLPDPPSSASGIYKIELNPEVGLQAIKSGRVLKLRLPDNKLLQFSSATTEERAKGVISVSGISANDEKASFTISGRKLFGHFTSQGKSYRVETRTEGSVLLTPEHRGFGTSMTMSNDALIPSRPKQLGGSSGDTAKALPKTQGMAQIDLMFVYTNEYSAQFGSGLSARLEQLVNSLNSILQTSQVDAEFRLVHSLSTNYSNDGSTLNALQDITNGVGVFQNIERERQNKGADMVALLRRYTIAHVNEGLCGFAWINGVGRGSLDSFDAGFAYSVTQLGRADTSSNSFSFCDEAALAHEIGHNLGLEHNRASTSNVGVFPYSHGYDVSGLFNTVMSVRFTGLKQFSFSNPGLQCRGIPCGISADNPNSADSARSLNNVVGQAANFVRKSIVISPVTSLLLDD